MVRRTRMTMPKPTPFKIISDIVSKADYPWEYEPDLYEWTHRGVECIARRNLTHGAWCGYVDVPYENWIKYDTLAGVQSIDDLIDVHGGVTFNEYIFDKAAHRIGFDCAHGGDKMPKIPFSGVSYEGEILPSDAYRDLAFVIAECESMVDQILKVTGGSTPS
jgi:hypothetical protein